MGFSPSRSRTRLACVLITYSICVRECMRNGHHPPSFRSGYKDVHVESRPKKRREEGGGGAKEVDKAQPHINRNRDTSSGKEGLQVFFPCRSSPPDRIGRARRREISVLDQARHGTARDVHSVRPQPPPLTTTTTTTRSPVR